MECWKPEEDLPDDLMGKIANVLNTSSPLHVLYNKEDRTTRFFTDDGKKIESFSKHEALDKLLEIASSVIEVLDEARIQVSKSDVLEMMRVSDTPPDLDYGMIEVNDEDLESAAETLGLGPNEIAALKKRRAEISWEVAEQIMCDEFMPIVQSVVKETLSELAKLN